MRTNQDYENYYTTVLEAEREKIIDDFVTLSNNKESGHNLEWKIIFFGDSLNNKSENIFRIKMPDQVIEDRYYKDLTSRFHNDKSGYEAEEFYLKFLEVEVPDIKQTVKNNSLGARPEIFNASKEDTLKYIAIYYALKGLLDDYPSTINQVFSDAEAFITIWRDKKAKDNPKEESENKTGTFIISGKMNGTEIERYFMQLIDIHSDYPDSRKDKICVLTTVQVKELLNPQEKKQKYSTPNFSQQQLRVFIYQFKQLHKSKDNNVMEFVKFEIDNFEAFNGLIEEGEYSNFNKGNVRLSPPYDTFNTNTLY